MFNIARQSRVSMLTRDKNLCNRFVAERSNNFVVGLTDVSPTAAPPTLWNYDVCGQYPGAVPAGATVPLQCACSVKARRYVIVQFPSHGLLNFCELEVFISRKLLFYRVETRRGMKFSANPKATLSQLDTGM